MLIVSSSMEYLPLILNVLHKVYSQIKNALYLTTFSSIIHKDDIQNHFIAINIDYYVGRI